MKKAILLLRVIVIFDYVDAAIGMHLNPFTKKGDSEVATI